jgi:CrcB protein
MIVVLAMVGSGVGALARYGAGGVVQRRTRGTRPWGTAVVNVGGAVLLGVLVGLHAGGHLDDDLLTIVGAGFCGGFTTFSTWMVESVRLGEEGAGAGLVAVGVNVGVMLVVGIAGAALAVTLAG